MNKKFRGIFLAQQTSEKEGLIEPIHKFFISMNKNVEVALFVSKKTGRVSLESLKTFRPSMVRRLFH